jgi:hypothetical protein
MTRGGRLIGLVLAAVLVLCAHALPASAFYSATGTGSGAGVGATLTAATIAVPGTATNVVAVTWTQQAVLSPSVPAANSAITYTVQRKLGAGAYANVTAGPCSGALAYNITTCADSPGAAGTYTYRAIADYRTWTATSADSGTVAVTIDTTPPTVASVNRAAASPTDATSVSWTVTFSESVSGVDATDFSLVRSGVAGGAVSVSGSGTTRTVTATGYSGTGTLGLNLVDDDSITDGGSNPLGGSGAGNGNFTGQVYSVDTVAPTATITRSAANPSSSASVTWLVTFSESVSGVGSADFALVRGGSVSGGSITSVTGSATTYTVTASTGSGSGTLGLNLLSDGTVIDSVGNVAPAQTGAVYTMDRTAPALVSMMMQDTDTDGRVDRIVATFNETLATSTLTSQWTLANAPSGATLASVSTSGTTATLDLNEGGGAQNTAVGTFTLALAANASGIRDTLGNESAFAATAPSDDAAPVVVNGGDTDGSINGKLQTGDTVFVVFSEPIASAINTAPTLTLARGASGDATLSISGFTSGAGDLGATGYVTTASKSINFAATAALSAGNTTITVTAGACSTNCTFVGTQTSPAAVVVLLSPSLTDAAGNPTAGTLLGSLQLF